MNGKELKALLKTVQGFEKEGIALLKSMEEVYEEAKHLHQRIRFHIDALRSIKKED